MDEITYFSGRIKYKLILEYRLQEIVILYECIILHHSFCETYIIYFTRKLIKSNSTYFN